MSNQHGPNSLALCADHPYAKLWYGVNGKAVMIFGVIVPALMLSLFSAFCAKRLTLVLLNHPLETIAELLLLLSIPFFNYRLWRALSNGQVKASLKKGLACGIALSSSVLMAIVSIASLFGGSGELSSQIGTGFSTGFMLLAVLAVFAAIASSYIFSRFRNSLEFSQSRKSLTHYVSVGAILPVVVLLASEIAPWSVRVLERSAIAGSVAERKQSLDVLRSINPERQMRMECGDQRAAGLCGMFLPIKSSAQHELYFAVTGKPYTFRSYANNDLSSMPDDYVSRHVVGDKIAGLSLVRSVLSGNVHANTLTATMDWTFVLKNGSISAQEMRAEIGLPADAVVTNATFWNAGEPSDLTTVRVNSGSYGYSGDSAGYMVSDLGHGKVLLKCQTVEPDEELKVRLTVVTPLKSEGRQAAVVLPHLIASNFNHEGDQQVKLTSDRILSSVAENLVRTSFPGRTMITGNLTVKQLEGSDPGITVDRSNESNLPAVALDMSAVELAEEDAKSDTESQKSTANNNSQVMVMIDGSSGVDAEQIAKLRSAMNKTPEKKQNGVEEYKPSFVVQSMAPSRAVAPDHLVVVLDGSATMRSRLKQVKEALRNLPEAESASLIVASQEQAKFNSARPLKEALAALKESDFVGGQDNLKAVIQGAELAGQTAGRAVFWIHGPQPVLNQEIYILTPFAAKPTFYELPVEIGPIDTYEFFKNHSEIGSFVQVASPNAKNEKENLSAAMQALYTKWDPQNTELVAKLALSSVCPANRQLITEAEGGELAALRANQECLRLIAARDSEKASRIALKYGLVTPVSCAAAVAGSGEQSDATVIRGVNTAGAVRVNNLANLEALLNILANLFEIIFACAGLAIVVEAFLIRGAEGNVFGLHIPCIPRIRVGIGVAMITLGLGIPGMINWFVASARDANLFS